MAIFRKLLKNRKGDIIIPVVDLMEDYSTSEINTGRHWTDGKTIYTKTFFFQQLGNDGAVTQLHGISNIDKAIKFECVMENAAATSWWDASYTSLSVASSDTQIILRSISTDLRTYKAWVTMYYTKSS